MWWLVDARKIDHKVNGEFIQLLLSFMCANIYLHLCDALTMRFFYLLAILLLPSRLRCHVQVPLERAERRT